MIMEEEDRDLLPQVEGDHQECTAEVDQDHLRVRLELLTREEADQDPYHLKGKHHLNHQDSLAVHEELKNMKNAQDHLQMKLRRVIRKRKLTKEIRLIDLR